ncbi:transposase and inactivated derivative [Paenibacillus popilliae ATCC 14706]|uniref:Transposase and inactivated derivative n=1 Tax=Paenibacillus popilliae ATCC 14706 TaxID=1212764 RepID=M9LHA1_PAEPP|nr:transposase and inactivated derivative [Paenibacillus popilliae ATCC 14706]
MILGKKVRIKPTPEQEEQLWRSAGTARWAYNWTLARQEENYRDGGKFISDGKLRKELTELKQMEGYAWLYNVSNNIAKQAVKDACDSFKKFFKKQSAFPLCSNGMVFKNINKSAGVRKMEERLRGLQRRVSRKYEMNKEGSRFVKTCNIVKVEKSVRLLHRRLTNIRTNHVHQATNAIAKTKPGAVAVEYQGNDEECSFVKSDCATKPAQVQTPTTVQV